MSAPSTDVDYDPYPPCGFDRADGLDGRPGTATPNGVLQTRTASGLPDSYLEELPDSPTIERGEQNTCVHTYRCDPVTAQSIVEFTSRGDLQGDSSGNVWKVLGVRMSLSKGNSASVTITSECVLGLDTPPDEFTIDVIEFNPALQKHPRYSPITLKNKYLIQRLQNKGDILALSDFSNIIDSAATSGTVEGLAMGELIAKLRKGIDSFYLAGFRINYSVYSNFPQLLNPGGYVEDPVESAIIPYYFTSDDQTPAGQSIFDFGDDYLMLYANGLAYLRLCDSQTYQRTWFKKTMSWIAAPGGGTQDIGGESFDWLSIWDADIYSRVFGGYNDSEIQ